jgi:hypothetical protein
MVESSHSRGWVPYDDTDVQEVAVVVDARRFPVSPLHCLYARVSQMVFVGREENSERVSRLLL